MLAQIRVDATTNGHEAALERLGILPAAGKAVAGDAVLRQRDVAANVVDSGGDYRPVATDNREALTVDVRAALAFEDAARGIAAATSACGHAAAADRLGARGRVEVAGTEAGGRVAARAAGEREGGVEVPYAITGRSPDGAGGERLSASARDHRPVEGRLHSVRDGTLGGDACRVPAALRDAVVHLLAGGPADSHPAAIEHLRGNPDRAHRLIGIPRTR